MAPTRYLRARVSPFGIVFTTERFSGRTIDNSVARGKSSWSHVVVTSFPGAVFRFPAALVKTRCHKSAVRALKIAAIKSNYAEAARAHTYIKPSARHETGMGSIIRKTRRDKADMCGKNVGGKKKK